MAVVSLLDRGPDTISVYVEESYSDEYGTPHRRSVDTPITVRCRVQPLSSADDESEVSTMYRVIARSLPAGPWARIVFDGRDWDVKGDVLRSNGSRATRHDLFVMAARRPEPLR